MGLLYIVLICMGIMAGMFIAYCIMDKEIRFYKKRIRSLENYIKEEQRLEQREGEPD